MIASRSPHLYFYHPEQFFSKVMLIKSINILASFVLFTFFFLGVFDTSYFRFALYLVVSRTNQNKSSTEFETTQLSGPSYLFQRQLSRETYFLHQQCGIAIPILNEQTPCLGVEKHLQSRSILSKSDFKGGLPLRPGVFIPKLGRMFLERGPSKGDI